MKSLQVIVILSLSALGLSFLWGDSHPYAANLDRSAAINCRRGEWRCDDGRECIPEARRCDRRPDCTDYSDERGCDIPPARRTDRDDRRGHVKINTEFQRHRQGEQVVADCSGADIDTRTIKWQKEGGRLPPGVSPGSRRLYIPRVSATDAGRYVCSARSNTGHEVRATMTLEVTGTSVEQRQAQGSRSCDRNRHQCGNQDCTNPGARCDRFRDCEDGSDERDCRDPHDKQCEPNEMLCDNNRCIQKMWACDGDNDCGDNSDERPELCPDRGTNQGRCQKDQFKCDDGQCIKRSFVCDQQNDCRDQSDERSCRKPETKVPPPTNKRASRGETVTITCKAIGFPTAFISWRLNWGHTCGPPRCTQTTRVVDGMEVEGEITIRDVDKRDAGAYTCEAINQPGRILVVPDCILEVIDEIRPQNCNPPGTISFGPPCQCKQHVIQGGSCDRCKPNNFWLDAQNPYGCIACFCNGVTSECSSSSWRRTEVRVRSSGPLEVVDRKGVVVSGVTARIQGGDIVVDGGSDQAYYVKLPAEFLGNALTAYGGKVTYMIRMEGGFPRSDQEADVVFKGNNVQIEFKHDRQVSSDFTMTFKVYETELKDESGRQATREYLLMTLADVDTIMVRVTYSGSQSRFTISDMVMTRAEVSGSGQQAFAVEDCRCPPGYKGLSCEECADGYQRTGGGLYLGTCERATGPDLRCNITGTKIDRAPSSCVCKDNVRDRECDVCKPGFFWLSPRNRYGCLECWCNKAASECKSSTWWRTQVKSMFTNGDDGYRVRSGIFGSSGRVIEPRSQFRTQTDPPGIIFDDFSEAPNDDAFYLSLPQKFLGNKVSSYGGGLTLMFTYRGDSRSEWDRPDVILRGNGITIFYYHGPNVNPRTLDSMTVNFFENDWKFWPQSDFPEHVTVPRGHFMKVISNLDLFLIKISYSKAMESYTLFNLTLDIAKPFETQSHAALAVEQCSCPPGYEGTSCEKCQSGYTLREDTNVKGDRYMECIRGGAPQVDCNRLCKGRARSCDTNRCDCDYNWEPPFCDRCRPGYEQRGDRCEPTRGPPPVPTVTINPPRLDLQSGDNIEAVCRSSDPGARITWRRYSGEPLGPNVQETSSTPGEAILRFNNFQPRDAGQYVCEATNAGGSGQGYLVVSLC